MTSALAKQTEREIARPLRVLVPLIKDDLKNGDEAAKSASMPFYAAAGAKMIEARDGNNLTGAELYAWTKRNFDLGQTQTKLYMDYAELQGSARATSAKSFKSLEDFQRRHLGRDRPTSGRSFKRDWISPIDDIAERAKLEAARIHGEQLSREKERQAEYQLALRLIDIGYKVLAKELHPDKGGSRDAMARLSRVRDRLKSHA